MGEVQGQATDEKMSGVTTNAPKKSKQQQEQHPRITNDLRNFYAQHGIDVDRLAADKDEANLCFATRFFRLNPRMDPEETLLKLKVS